MVPHLFPTRISHLHWFKITCEVSFALHITFSNSYARSQQYLSIPIYTIWKNITIILIAYGEVLWFDGKVTGLALVSFGLMICSSLLAASTDIGHAISSLGTPATTTESEALLAGSAAAKLSQLNAGYVWMMINCLCSAGYVLAMRKRIKTTNFKVSSSALLALCELA